MDEAERLIMIIVCSSPEIDRAITEPIWESKGGNSSPTGTAASLVYFSKSKMVFNHFKVTKWYY